MLRHDKLTFFNVNPPRGEEENSSYWKSTREVEDEEDEEPPALPPALSNERGPSRRTSPHGCCQTGQGTPWIHSMKSYPTRMTLPARGTGKEKYIYTHRPTQTTHTHKWKKIKGALNLTEMLWSSFWKRQGEMRGVGGGLRNLIRRWGGGEEKATEYETALESQRKIEKRERVSEGGKKFGGS